MAAFEILFWAVKVCTLRAKEYADNLDVERRDFLTQTKLFCMFSSVHGLKYIVQVNS